jgi:small multidrug resistance family-3 protein
MMLVVWLVFIGASLLEVGGDAVGRKGLRGSRALVIVAGCLMLAGYGLLVNAVSWNFSKLLGVYIASFATTSILWGASFSGRMCLLPCGWDWRLSSSAAWSFSLASDNGGRHRGYF